MAHNVAATRFTTKEMIMTMSNGIGTPPLGKMKFKHFFDHPSAHLSIDETLLDVSEHTSQAFLRFWESPSYFVVLGASNKIETEVESLNCDRDSIPIFKRCSGGGTVLQGPGCLNYALILPISTHPDLLTISGTTQFIMTRQANALNAQVQGPSDLTINNLKISGNAQRRKRKSVLFHGTCLYNFNLEKISTYLKMPSKAPDYRQNRPHSQFVANLPQSREKLIDTISKAWEAFTA